MLLLLQFLSPPLLLLIHLFLLQGHNTISLQTDWFVDWLIDPNISFQIRRKWYEEKSKFLEIEEKIKLGHDSASEEWSFVDLSPSCLHQIQLWIWWDITDGSIFHWPGSFSPHWPKRAFSLPGSQNDRITFKINKSEIRLSFPLIESWQIERWDFSCFFPEDGIRLPIRQSTNIFSSVTRSLPILPCAFPCIMWSYPWDVI